MKVIIAEKKDQGKKLAAPFKHKENKGYIEIFPCKTFPNGAYITWAIGHLYSLAKPEEYDAKYKTWSLDTLPIIPNTFKYVKDKNKAAQTAIINKLLHDPKVKEIIIGTDPGREGEAIGRIIIQMSGSKKPIKRLWTNSLTPKAIERAFHNLLPEQSKRSIYYEAQSRAFADWLVGINTSRAYSLLFQQKGIKEIFSTGRVQTPLLAMIVKREIELENFVSTPFWSIYADFVIEGKNYRGKWFKENEHRITDKEKAYALAKICKNKTATVYEKKTERKEFQPPQLFDISELQLKADKLYRYSPKKTLDICQSLYEAGYISYPRSDSRYVTEEEAESFPEILDKLSGQKEYKDYFPTPIKSIISNKRFVDAKKTTDHHAIIPTENVPNLSSLSDEQRNIYDLIARSLIAAHYDHAIFDYTRLITLVDNRFTFETKGKQLIHEGWHKVILNFKNPNDEDQEDKENESFIPDVNKGDMGIVLSTNVEEGKTQPPKRYSEGDLISLMENAGKTIEDRDLSKILNNTKGLGTKATRANIIEVLKKQNYIEIKKNKVFATNKGRILIEAIGQSLLTSAELTAKWEQRLSEIGEGKYSAKEFVEQAKKLTIKLLEDAKTKSNTWNFPNYSTQKMALDKKIKINDRSGDSLGSCKICGQPVIDKGYQYGCSHCDFTIPKIILGKSISKTNIKKILTQGESDIIKGFKKDGKSFDSILYWNQQKKKLSFKRPIFN